MSNICVYLTSRLRMLILPPFFTPATLFVMPSTASSQVEQIVPFLAIANSAAGHRFAYSPPMNTNSTQYKDTSRIFAGPRTILTLLSNAASSLGRILPINPPYNSSSYSVEFYGPAIRCQNANDSTIAHIQELLRRKMNIPLGTATEVESAYFAFVPDIDQDGNFIALSQPRYQEPSKAFNTLWMTYNRTVPGGIGVETIYKVCNLHNSTISLNMTWDKGAQNITGSYTIGEQIHSPHDKIGDVSNLAQHAYSAWMWTLTDQLVGSFAWYNETQPRSSWGPAQFGVINSAIQHNGLLGSSDLDYYFQLDEKYKLYSDQHPNRLSDQRLQDKELARNRTLDILIEELGFNITVSLMQNPLLTLVLPALFRYRRPSQPRTSSALANISCSK